MIYACLLMLSAAIVTCAAIYMHLIDTGAPEHVWVGTFAAAGGIFTFIGVCVVEHE